MEKKAKLKIKRENGEIEIVTTPYSVIKNELLCKIRANTAAAGRGTVLCVIDENGQETQGIFDSENQNQGVKIEISDYQKTEIKNSCGEIKNKKYNTVRI